MQKYVAVLLTGIYFSEGLTGDEDNEGRDHSKFQNKAQTLNINIFLALNHFCVRAGQLLVWNTLSHRF